MGCILSGMFLVGCFNVILDGLEIVEKLYDLVVDIFVELMIWIDFVIKIKLMIDLWIGFVMRFK